MSVFASDEFTNSSGTVLTTHSAEWTRHSSYSTDCQITDANRLRASAVGYSLHYRNETPGSADYDVIGDVRVITFTGRDEQCGVVGRCSTSADTCYRANIKTWTTDELRLSKIVSGVVTLLGSAYGVTLATNTTYQVKLTMSGSTIKAFLDGTERVSVTDTAVTDAGKAGIQLGYASASTPSNSAGLHLDSFSADQAGIGPLILSDAISMSDGGARNYEKLISDALALADSLAKTGTKSVTNAISLSDSLATVISLFLQLTNALPISDARSLTVTKAVSNALALADLLSNTATKTLTQSFSIADAVTTFRSLLLELADALGLADSSQRTLTPGAVETIVLTVVERAARRGMLAALQHFPTSYVIGGQNKAGVLNENDGDEQMLDAGYTARRRATLVSLREVFTAVPVKGAVVTIGTTDWRVMSVAHDRVHVRMDLSSPKL